MANRIIVWIDANDGSELFDAIIGSDSVIPSVGDLDQFTGCNEEPPNYIVREVIKYDGGDVDVICERCDFINPN